MTVTVSRSYDVDASIDHVWDLLSDDRKRAETIDFVENFETKDGKTYWYLRLPIPLVDRTVSVETRDVELRSPNYVKFVGRSKLMSVTGEHELEERENGCRVRNRFVVDGKVPGVEKFFKENIDEEIENIMHSLSNTVTLVEDD